MTPSNLARVLCVVTAVAVAAGSATSSNNNQNGSMMPPQGQAGEGPPPPQQMDPARALGLWRSTFGAVKVEADNSKGGIQSGAVQGVWVYQRQGQEVIGYFAGNLRGNVLEFRWQEPNNPPLVGGGYLVFDQQGRQYNGRWWTDRRDRVGAWNGWRQGGNNTSDPNNQPYGDPNGGTSDPNPGDPDANQPYDDGRSPARPPRPPGPAQPAPGRTYY